MCRLCHRPLLYFSLIRNGPPPMSTLVPAWRRCRCCSYAGSLRGTCPTSAQTSNWHSETQISSLQLSPSCHHVARLRRKAWYLDTRGFILKKIQWHIHAGSWSLVNCWREALTRHYIRCSWILMNAAVSLMDGLSLDGDRCIRVIPRHVLFTPSDSGDASWNAWKLVPDPLQSINVDSDILIFWNAFESKEQSLQSVS